MKLSIITIGSRGDVQPYVALGCGLQKAGFDVSIVTYEYYRQFIEAYGLKLKPLQGDPKEILGSENGRNWVRSQGNPVKFVKNFIALTKARIAPMMKDAVEQLADAEIILYSDLGIVGYHVAEKYQTPLIETHLQPFGITKTFPSVGAPPWIKLGGLYNQISHWVTEQMLWQPFRTLVNDLRRTELDLRPIPFWGPFKKIKTEGNPTLHAYSPHVLPKPSDWPRWRHVTGNWVLPPEPGWQPDPKLVDFLNAGKPPVYVGFGSMVDEEPEKLVEMVLTAVSHTNNRIILSSGWAGFTASNLPDNAYIIQSVPHEWLLPQMAAVIHHGGAGTTAAGLRSGVPSMAAPYFADQFFWADRIYNLGVSPKLPPRPKLTMDILTHAIQEATQNSVMKNNAARIGQLLHAEDGIETAVKIIKKFANQHCTK
ncbi:MAG: glycosyltransferase [Chloroflexota bacterium]